MKEIQLLTGHVALVDDADYEWLSQWKWTAHQTKTHGYYAARHFRIGPRKMGRVFMHRELASPAPGLEVDHVNGDKLDNRRCNLRCCTLAQNQCNRGPQCNNTSGFKGVSWNKRRRKWRSYVGNEGMQKQLGYFNTKIAAAIEYNIAAVQLHGEFAKLNDVFSGEVPL